MMKDSKAPAPQSCEHDKPGAWERKEGGCLTNFSKKVSPKCPFCAPKAQADEPTPARKRALEILPVINLGGESEEPESRRTARNLIETEIEIRMEAERGRERAFNQLKSGLEYEANLLANNDRLRQLFETLKQNAICALHPGPTLSMIVQLCDEGRKVGLSPARFEAHAPTQPSPKAPQEREAILEELYLAKGLIRGYPHVPLGQSEEINLQALAKWVTDRLAARKEREP